MALVLTRRAVALASRNPSSPLEVVNIDFSPSDYAADRYPIGLSLWCPSPSAIIASRVPRVVLAGRPLDIALGGPLCRHLDSAVSLSLARSIALHANLSIVIEASGVLQTSLEVPVSVHRSDKGWAVRALVCPATWADAKSVAVVGLSFAGRPLPCASIPAILRVGYNHAYAPAGAVLAAAKVGDVPALHTALDDGGSTEETNEVGNSEGVAIYRVVGLMSQHLPVPRIGLLLPSPWQDAHTASWWAAYTGHAEVLSSLVAAGANPATKDLNGVTPLHNAAIYGHLRVIALLLATPGVDPLTGDGMNWTAWHYARSNGNTAAVALLEADPRVAAAHA